MLGFSSLKKRRLKGNQIAFCSFLKRGNRKGDVNLFSPATDDKSCRSSTKLHQGRFRLDSRRDLITMWVIKHSNNLPREVIESHACQFSRGIWTTISLICFNF